MTGDPGMMISADQTTTTNRGHQGSQVQEVSPPLAKQSIHEGGCRQYFLLLCDHLGVPLAIREAKLVVVGACKYKPSVILGGKVLLQVR